MKSALIAMSGGVDSSVAAFLMKSKGYDCVGVTMKLFDNDNIVIERERSCCSLSDVEDARSVCVRLGMPYYVLNFKEGFEEKVIKNFVETYENGGTPNPCIDCNRYLKFDLLYKKAQTLGLHYIVTGHYATVQYDENTGRYLLKKGKDITKDQSYVLFNLTQEQLSHTIFPLGEYEKTHIREIAGENGFINANKKDSQDICFVQDGNYADFIEKYRGKKYEHGEFVYKDGSVLGEHKGIINYTVGQRKGLGISHETPLYVIDKDIKNNRVILGERADLLKTDVLAHDINMIAFESVEKPIHCCARTRYNMREKPGTLYQIDSDTIKFSFDEPQAAITLGQALVVYDGNTVLCGGTIF